MKKQIHLYVRRSWNIYCMRGIIAGAVIQALGNIAASGLVIGVGVLIGLALMLYAQFKYNRDLF